MSQNSNNNNNNEDTGFFSVTPLVGAVRDEIAEQVLRLRQADKRLQQPAKPQVSSADRDWAEGQNLPTEFFDFFVIQRA